MGWTGSHYKKMEEELPHGCTHSHHLLLSLQRSAGKRSAGLGGRLVSSASFPKTEFTTRGVLVGLWEEGSPPETGSGGCLFSTGKKGLNKAQNNCGEPVSHVE